MLTSSDLLDSLTDVQNLSEALYPLFGVEGFDGSYADFLYLEDFGFNAWHSNSTMPKLVRLYVSSDTHSFAVVLPVNFGSYRVIVVNALSREGLHSDTIDKLIAYFGKMLNFQKLNTRSFLAL